MTQPLKTEQSSEIFVDEIVNRLFTNGAGEKAKRLVLELEDKLIGGGWCKDAVRDHIRDVLSAALNSRAGGQSVEKAEELDKTKIYFWASICSRHRTYDAGCKACQAGSWMTQTFEKIFEKHFQLQVSNAELSAKLKLAEETLEIYATESYWEQDSGFWNNDEGFYRARKYFEEIKGEKQ